MSWAEDNGYEYDGDYIHDVRRLELLLDEETFRLYWTTRDGGKIYIEDMQTSHIENIIRAGIAGRIDCDEKTEDRFLLELSLRRRRPLDNIKKLKNLPF